MSLFSAFGVGNGNPLQYFCRENLMDRGAWQATVHRVASVRKDWVTFTHFALPSGCNFHPSPDKAFPKHSSLLPPCSYLPSLLTHSLPPACCPLSSNALIPIIRGSCPPDSLLPHTPLCPLFCTVCSPLPATAFPNYGSPSLLLIFKSICFH